MKLTEARAVQNPWHYSCSCTYRIWRHKKDWPITWVSIDKGNGDPYKYVATPMTLCRGENDVSSSGAMIEGERHENHVLKTNHAITLIGNSWNGEEHYVHGATTVCPKCGAIMAIKPTSKNWNAIYK